MNEWNDLYVATAGAAAALTGLLFVGISINLTKILSYPSLPTRASISITLLMAVLLVSVLLLAPIESTKLTGWLILLVGVVVWAIIARADIKSYRLTPKPYKEQFLRNVFFDQLSVFPYTVGGIWLIAAGKTGLYWVLAAIVLSFVKAVYDAWVLLIEILR